MKYVRAVILNELRGVEGVTQFRHVRKCESIFSFPMMRILDRVSIKQYNTSAFERLYIICNECCGLGRYSV